MVEEIYVLKLIKDNIALKIENEKLKEVINDVRQKLSSVMIGHTAKRERYGHMP